MVAAKQIHRRETTRNVKMKTLTFVGFMVVASFANANANESRELSSTSNPAEQLKYQQVLDALSNSLDRMADLEVKIKQLSAVTEQMGQIEASIENLGTRIDRLKMDSANQKDLEEINTFMANLNQDVKNLDSSLDLLETDLNKTRQDQENIDDRLSKVEIYNETMQRHEKIIKDEDGNAIVFDKDFVGDLSVSLPVVRDCSSLGATLESYPQRSYNAFFVTGSDGQLRLCKRVGGEWSLFDATPFESGHVIAE